MTCAPPIIGEYIVDSLTASLGWFACCWAARDARPYAPGLSSTLFAFPVIIVLLILLVALDDDDVTWFELLLVIPFPFPMLPPELVFCMLQRLVPLDKKLPNEMDPFALMKGVVRCC